MHRSFGRSDLAALVHASSDSRPRRAQGSLVGARRGRDVIQRVARREPRVLVPRGLEGQPLLAPIRLGARRPLVGPRCVHHPWVQAPRPPPVIVTLVRAIPWRQVRVAAALAVIGVDVSIAVAGIDAVVVLCAARV